MATLENEVFLIILDCWQNELGSHVAAQRVAKLVEEKFASTNSAMDAIALLRQWDKYMVIGTSVNLAELLRKTRELVQQHQ